MYSSEFDSFDTPVFWISQFGARFSPFRAAPRDKRSIRRAYERARRRAAPRRALPVEIDFRTELKLKSRSRNREKKWPISLGVIEPVPRVVGEARRAREEPGKRKVRHGRRRWPTRRLSGSLTPLENTLLTARRYVLHTPPRAVLRLEDALVYFAHRRHRSPSSSSVSSSSIRGGLLRGFPTW